MPDVNVAGIATGAFLGVLALIAAIACVPPITRFLGDLFCCPWRLPFTKRKRRNADEEVGSDELPYVVEPRPQSAVDDAGYQHMSEAYMSAVSVVDPGLAAKEEMRRSTEYRGHHDGPGSSHSHTDPFRHPNDSYYNNNNNSSSHSSLPSSVEFYHHQQHHYGSQLDVPTPPPHGGMWNSSRGTSREQLHHAYSSDSVDQYGAAEQHHQHQHHHPHHHHYSPERGPYHAEPAYSPPVEHHRVDDGYGHHRSYVQRPLPSHPHVYSPPEAVGGPAAGYFLDAAYDQHDHERHHPSTEELVGARGRK